jgi:hypothetical protein
MDYGWNFWCFKSFASNITISNCFRFLFDDNCFFIFYGFQFSIGHHKILLNLKEFLIEIFKLLLPSVDLWLQECNLCRGRSEFIDFSLHVIELTFEIINNFILFSKHTLLLYYISASSSWIRLSLPDISYSILWITTSRWDIASLNSLNC